MPLRLIDDALQDLRQSVRQIRRAPGFALLAILCLGIGIGINTAIFSVVHAVLLRPMPVTEPDRLLTLNRGGEGGALSYSEYLDLAARTQTLSGLTAVIPMESDLDLAGDSEFIVAEVATASYASVLGVSPLLGRWFSSENEPAAVISEAVWERRFNRDPQVIGRQIRSESQAYTIVGVAPARFTGVT